MYRRVAERSALRIAITLTTCAALLPLPSVVSLVSEAAQGQSDSAGGKVKPRPGKPEGEWPNLDQVKTESRVEREAPPPIPSTIRSKRNSGKPWDGRRVGDPEPLGGLGQAVVIRSDASSIARNQKTRRAHARGRMNPPPPVLDDQFVQNFFTWCLARNPVASETSYWYDHLRVAYGQGQESLKLAAIELGRTLFESAEYAARSRNDHLYVYDLYKTYLMREPDSGGWTSWEQTVGTHGREYVRRGFEESWEFATLIGTIVPNGSASSAAASLVSARVDPRNQPGNGMLTRDASWSVPLLSLPGRAGLDLGLALSYSSMVWTRSGPYIYFDEDNGFPSPGFRLGFPTIQRKVFDAQTARNVYLLITASGQRVELRQVGTSNIYDAADFSYLRLTDNGSLVVQSTDGTRLNFVYFNGEFRCTEVKDRNGNYITVNYNSLGQLTNITDTLGRLITFNYDIYANLLSITQAWNGQPSHQWVGFGWGTRNLQSSFSGAALVGVTNGTLLPVVTQVTLNDTSQFTFDYTNSLQVSVIRNYFGTLERNSTTFTYETPAGDTPRLLDSRVSAHNWTGLNNVPSQVITQYSVAGDGACVMTAPDGTVYKEYYGTGWQKGLTVLSEVWSGGVRRKWTTTAWTQDNTSLSYPKNPRPYDTSVYDEAGNRRRTEIVYTTYNLPDAVALPTEVKEYAANGTTVLRRTTTTYYEGGQPYIDRRVLGLLREVMVYDGNNQPQSKVWYDYDWDTTEYWAPTPQPATQHDGSGGARGRGNLVWIGRWDVTDINNFDKHTRSFIRYNRTGSVIRSEDHFGHGNSISYTDSFSDNVNRNTFAYATTVTNADGFGSNVQYNFDFGATTRTQRPPPAGQSQGAIQTMAYNNLGQLERVTTTNNGAYTRYVYGPDYAQSFATVNNIADEAYAIQVFDGVGRVTGSAGNHPGSTGAYRAQMTTYDLMGRAVKTSNPAEINAAWVPTGDDAAGWLYTQQTYDWKGRPRITTNTDLTTKEASYSGCGCAGGEVVTLTDEGTISDGVAKRRQQKIYADVLGRTVKTEILNWENGSIYSATVTTYNARDQITDLKQYAGSEAAGNPHQDTTITYDGHGRLKTKHMPQESVGTQTTWTYNADDTVNTITDPRGAVSIFGYAGTNRKLVKTVTHTLSGKPTINITFDYDAAGNRVSMSDQSGTSSYSYNQLSQLTAESRTLGGTTYSLSYQYNLAGQLKKMTYPGNMSINYGYDTAGRLNAVTGSDTLYQGITQYASGFTYRASGARKTMTDGANRTSTVTYDARLRPLNYQISGVVNQTYEYYNDGRMKFVSNASDSNFDRSYTYDHADRLTFAFTGGAARGDLGAIPYFETYGYNAWGDVTSRFTETWSQDEFGDAATYINGRRDGWQYEADGRIKTIDTRDYSYDAAANRVSMTGQIWSGSNYFPTSTTSAYDGDQMKVEEVSSWPAFTTKYLHSTVLRGEIVQEINSAGQTINYVYLTDGTQLSTLNGPAKWRHETPGATGLYETFQSGFVNRVEFDPYRANVGLTAPPPPDTNGGDGDIGSSHSGGQADSRFSNMANPAAGCFSVDGIDLPCTWSVFDVYEFFVWGPAKHPAASTASDLWVWVPSKRTFPVNIPNPFDQFLENPPVRTDATYALGYWRAAPAPFVNISAQKPQRLTDDQHRILADDLAKLFQARKDCLEFVSGLLLTVAVNTQRSLFSLSFISDPLQIFKEIEKQDGVGIQPDLGEPGQARGDLSSGGDKANIVLPSISFTGLSWFRGFTILHEVLHFAAAQGVFLDSELARAGYQVAWAQGYTVKPPPLADGREANSLYFDDLLFKACNPYQRKK